MPYITRKVLEIARELASQGKLPTVTKVSEITGHGRGTVCVRVKKLREKGFWPWPKDKSGGRDSTKWWAPDLASAIANVIRENLPDGSPVGLRELAMLADVSVDKVEVAITALESQGRWAWRLDQRPGKSYLMPAIYRRVRDIRRRQMRGPQPRSRPEIATMVAEWRRRERERRRA
jgi:hypothetical protein